MKLEDLQDWIYPVASPFSEEELERQTTRDEKSLEETSAHPDPAKVAEAYDKLLASEDERLKSVESRLGSTLGLTSISASLLVGGTFALVNGSLSDSSRSVRWIAGFGLLYLSTQIICSTLAGVRGLTRSTWLRPEIDELISDPQTESIDIARERARNSCRRYQNADRNVNFKVTQMAVAHVAIRNFAIGSAAIAVLGFVAVLVQTPGDATAKAIRKDADLQNLLRGPQGPPGAISNIGLPQAQVPCTKASNGKDRMRHQSKGSDKKAKAKAGAKSGTPSGPKSSERSQVP